MSIPVEELVAELLRREQTNRLASYKPYPFQKAFHNAHGKGTEKPALQKALMAGNQIGKCSPITGRVTIDGEDVPIHKIWGGTGVRLTGRGGRPVSVVRWVRKPAEECYRVTMDDGRWTECSGGHLVLCDDGFQPLSRLLPRYASSRLRSSSVVSRLVRASDVVRWSGKLRGWMGRCFLDSRLRGGLLQSEEDGVQVFAPLQAGEQEHSQLLSPSGVLAYTDTSTAQPALARLANWGGGALTSVLCATCEALASRPVFELLSGVRRSVRRFSGWLSPGSTDLVGQAAESFSSATSVGGNKIVSIDPIGVHTLYDMEVVGHEYVGAGLVHHNTVCGSAEVAIQATGLYPDWWQGRTFSRATNLLVAGVSVDKTRDSLQTKLFGDPHDPEAFGTGWVPKDLIIGKPIRKQGYMDAYDSVAIRHRTGGTSRIQFQAYEQGFKKFMSTGKDVVQLDEEPDPDVYSQALRSIIATKGYIMLTFTPESGITVTVDQFMNNLGPGQAFIQAGWDDAPHIADDPEHREQLLAALPAHERDMRSKGIPVFGSGLIYPVPDELIACDPFPIPNHWPRIIGVDLGGAEDPFAAVWLAWDRDGDVVYAYKEYKNNGVLSIHADAIRQGGGNWIPIAWPHDMAIGDRKSGISTAETFRTRYGLNMLPDCFSNPPGPGQKEGQGGQGVEAGLYAINNAMETGGFRAFSSLSMLYREKNMYHRKDGKVVKQNDHLMDAKRYGFQMIRHADVRPRPRLVTDNYIQGETNW